MKKVIQFTRANIYKRDKGICYFCKKKVPIEEFVCIHKVLMSQGGKSTWDNMATAHIECAKNRI